MLTDKFSKISINRLFHIIFSNENSILEISKDLFYIPNENQPYSLKRFGHYLDNPIGVAAGPQTQMAQNIIAAWLCGARYIELKTVQTLDELEISKPCIDMQDEGYNCEWSQELKIQESYDEYLNAWIMIHVLQHKFGWEGDIGTIFNMSVGYNLEGILKENVQWFFNKMKNCKKEKDEKIVELSELYPDIKKINIPDCISDNITLSTMHGCPPDEIEKIASYLIEEKKLHTTIKLNPTLLGAKELRKILNDELEYKTIVPDIAFEHDLKYPDSLNIINSLTEQAKKNNIFFGIKLTNTLEVVNHKAVFPENEKMMYMSGRALHPISVNLAKKLQNEYKGVLDLSFSAGADCFNISDLIACGMKTVTVSSDLLKPGGYGRLKQYLTELEADFEKNKAKNTNDFIINNNNNKGNIVESTLINLNKYAESVIGNEAYKDPIFIKPNIKTSRQLKTFDCIKAPCVDTCPTNQDIPDYLYWTSKGNFENAYKVILKTNPFPSVLGMVCDHMCQSKCTRINYDNNILIREVKRFVADNNKGIELKANKPNNIKVGVIGAGPSGLSCSYFLALAGFNVTVYETKAFGGGMVSDAIPSFRLTKEAIEKDIDRIKKLGVNIIYNSKIDKAKFEEIKKNSDYVYIAVGAQKAKAFDVQGADVDGVLDPLRFLADVKVCSNYKLGKNIAVIGGGNTAMDVARTAYRLCGDGKVSIVYRRTKEEMPADVEEIKAVLKEGIEIIELVAPERVISENGKVKSLVLSKMKLSGIDSKGRPKPIKVENSEFELSFDTIIPALGQDLDINFVDIDLLKADKNTYETKIPNVFIGGDAYRGASTIIKAVADGRFVAENIIFKANVAGNNSISINYSKDFSKNDLLIKRALRNYGNKTDEIFGKKNFDIVTKPLNEETAKKEADRCLYCDEICNVCVSVCPNRANYSFNTQPCEIQLYKLERNGDKSDLIKDKLFRINQKYQVVNISDWCNECGNCTTFCPTNGQPFSDKPKFYLTIDSFNKVPDGYTISKLKDKKVIIFKEKNQIKTLTLQKGKYYYDTEYVSAEFDEKDFKLLNASFNVPCVKVAYFDKAAEMKILLEGIEPLYVENNLY